MKVKLIHYTPNAYELISEFAYISGVPKTMKVEDIVKMIVKNDYGSVLEHITFTFLLEDISIAISRELLEHRIASHTARSTRYVEETEARYYIPKEMPEEVLSMYKSMIESAFKNYKKLREMGVKKEYARYVLPLATLTTYSWTINARSLINFLTLRGCVRAAPEMRELACEIYAIVSRIYPEIFKDAICRGTWLKVCPENEARPPNCPYIGKIPTKKELEASSQSNI